MNKKEYILACISEECGEVSQMVGKCQRFGTDNTKVGRNTSNFEELRKEVHDIVATYEMLCEEMQIESKLSRKIILDKKKRVNFFMESSIRHGYLSE